MRTDRPLESYIHYGEGPHACLGMEASRVSITAMMKVVGRLDNLRRAPGPQGQLKKIPRPGGFYIYMREDHGSYFPFPTSKCTSICFSSRNAPNEDDVLTIRFCTAMKVNWDGELPPLKKL